MIVNLTERYSTFYVNSSFHDKVITYSVKNCFSELPQLFLWM